MLKTIGFRWEQILRARVALIGLAAVSALSIAASAVGFLFQVVLAARFGTGPAIDGYLFAISVPTFLAALGSAALSFAVVPALVQVEHDSSARAALLRSVLRRAVVIALVFAGIGAPAALVQQALIPPSAELRQLDGLPVMIFLGWVIGGVQFLAMLFTVELNASRRPVVAALLALAPNLGAVVIVLLAPRTILAAPIGVLAGSIAGLCAGALLSRKAFHGSDAVASAPTGLRVGRIGWTLIAMSCFSAYAIIDAFWAPRAGQGTLASLGYAQRLVIGIGGLILAGPSAILTPRFAARFRDGGGGPFLRDVVRTITVVGVLAMVTATVLALVAERLIGLAFGRGAFDVGDVARVANVFRAMLPGFCAMLVSVVLTRAIYCLPRVERPMAMIGLGWSAFYFVACGVALPLEGVGFGIAYSMAWALYALIATIILHRYASRASPAGVVGE